ncbi:MAG: helix-turn-helix transcriptional regulator [Veillonellales bacterium]
MAMAEKIRIVLIKRKMTISSLAEKLNTSPQNLSGKFSRDKFNEKELVDIANALDCTFTASFVLNDTGEKI